MTRRGWSLPGRAVACFAAGTGLILLVAGPPISAGNAAATTPTDAKVTLQGEGSWDPIGEMTTWQNDLFGASGAINLNYLAVGGFAGRQDFLAGTSDYVISGVPFTPEELKNLAHGANDLIDAPIQVSALGVMVGRPADTIEHRGFQVFRQVCDLNNPPDPLPPGLSNPEICANFIPYTGPVRLPAANLSAMLLNYPGGRPALRNWDNPDVTKAFGVTVSDPKDFMGGAQDGFIPPAKGPLALLRSEPSETDFYVQQYAATGAPAVWAAIQTGVHQTFGPVTERLAPGIGVQTRPGVTPQLESFEQTAANTTNNPGSLIAVPPWALGVERREAPNVAAEWVQVHNAVGEWVEPTPASIDAAVNAGGNTPMYALTSKVAGAYPIVWVNHLYAPAHGLSMVKTEAMAATIRYLATAGQGVTAAAGDGQLSPALVAQALAAANQLVLSNCAGTGASVVTNSDPGPLAPALKALQDVGPMLHCIATSNPATTTTSAAAAAAPARSASSASSMSSITAPAVTSGSGSIGASAATPNLATPATATAGATPAAGAAPVPPRAAMVNNAVALANLPLPTPESGFGQFDRFAAFLVGAGLLLLARKPFRWLIRTLQK